MKWYLPSWNGDVRLVDAGKGRTVLVVIEPTEEERKALARFQAECKKLKWWKGDLDFDVPVGKNEAGFDLDASVWDVGPVLVRAMRGDNPAVLTAVKFDTGGVETAAGTSIDLQALADKLAEEERRKTASEKPDEHASSAYREAEGGKKSKKEPEKKEKKPEAEAAATVKRPTPSCPACIPGSIEPAREVLLSFLTDEQHEEWAMHRRIVVQGHLSGARYLISHRHSPQAQKQGRICYDLDSRAVVHFHDTSVPPEEEVLAAKLILEHREPWLRNEATMLQSPSPGVYYSGGSYPNVFKNPFGDAMDGTQDASFTQGFGLSIMNQARVRAGLPPVDALGREIKP